MNHNPLYSHPRLTGFRQLIDRNAQEWPGQTTFRFRRSGEIVNITYMQFKREAEALAAYFKLQGFHRSRIAVLGENSYEWLLTYFAAVLSDNSVVPIDKALSDEDMAQFLVFSETELLVYADAYTDAAWKLAEGETVKMVLPMEAFSTILAGGGSITAETDESEICSIIFTSGTTKSPKGVILSQKALMTDAVGACQNVYMAGPFMLTLLVHHTFAFTAGVLEAVVSATEDVITAEIFPGRKNRSWSGSV
ncbi:MAG: acyl--CoA ligase [Lachnospiraceae bacterium]|jgi:long-chain acyl-CoA synthetase|nr:acyl--CoA ligase [Lachnospiraceae bacterium]